MIPGSPLRNRTGLEAVIGTQIVRTVETRLGTGPAAWGSRATGYAPDGTARPGGERPDG
jgi:hypothetical protein